MNSWQTTRFSVDLSAPRVMGIVNVTPDSFSDGGQHSTTHAAVRHCAQLIEQGADILDIGGESTRPGSASVSAAVELSRIVPVLREAVTLGVPVSIDTCKAEVMRAAIDLGVDIVNDIWALRGAGALEAVAASRCGVCLMHMHRDPMTMQASPMEGDAVHAVREFLDSRLGELQSAGIHLDRVVLDPGIGFGKTVAQNFALLARQEALLEAGRPLLVGWSRKSSLGAVTGIVEALERKTPSAVAAVLAVERGASIVRVHDVRDTVAALAVWRAVQKEQGRQESA
ncbi:MAG: dihydropteroate synthase [Gammaproteobacteria bacterium]|nr:dihydropteroate synthase [Gammaproteobacteria bacterium]MBU2285595.1 dihydropteroate synthase [Gammaproteobacteria bacterium]